MIKIKAKNEEDEIKQKKCPFYGFHMAMGFMIYQEGNQCALIADRYAPCQMESLMGREPNWFDCSFSVGKNKEVIETLKKEIKVFPPNELFQTKEGILLKEWFGFMKI